MLKIRQNSEIEKSFLINQSPRDLEKTIRECHELLLKKNQKDRRGDDFYLFEEYDRKNPGKKLRDIFKILLNQRLSLYSGMINLEQTNSALKEKNLGVDEPYFKQSGYDGHYSIDQTEKWIFEKEDLLMLFGCLSDPQYPYRLDYKLVFYYRNYRFSWLMDSQSLKVKQNRLFELKPSLTMRYINYGSFDLIRYKSPLEYPHRMLPSEFALPKSLLIDKIMLGKALMYEHLDKQLILDKTLINIVMDCSQIFDPAKPIHLVSSKIKALGGVILDLLFHYLHDLPNGQVDIRLICFTPSHLIKKEPKNLNKYPKFPLKLLHSKQWEIESSYHKLTRQFFESKKLSDGLYDDIISELKQLEGRFFSEWESVKNIVKLSPQQETKLKKMSRFLPETLLGFHQLSRRKGFNSFNSTDFFLQHHSLCRPEDREESYNILFELIFKKESDQAVDDSGTLNVSNAYKEEFAQLFRKLSIARGEEKELKYSKTYSSQHVCLITTKCELKNVSDWYNKSKSGDWDSLFHFEVSDNSPGLEFRGTDYTLYFRKNEAGEITQEIALENFLKRIMYQMIFARNRGGN
ncbi:MAG: hypothetical protein GY795_41495 [Desulfobacterales bacterium]|nr:hypothetical protein [Desulfobacterales bacterium]